MPTIHETIEIARPPEEVFDWMSASDNVALYSSNIQTYEQVAGDGMEVGARHRCVVRVAGRTLEFTDEVTAIDVGKRFVTRSDDGPIPYTLDIAVEPIGDGSRVIWHQETDSYGGAFGKLADPIVTKMYTRDVRSNLENAKTLLEG